MDFPLRRMNNKVLIKHFYFILLICDKTIKFAASI